MVRRGKYVPSKTEISRVEVEGKGIRLNEGDIVLSSEVAGLEASGLVFSSVDKDSAGVEGEELPDPEATGIKGGPPNSFFFGKKAALMSPIPTKNSSANKAKVSLEKRAVGEFWETYKE